MGSLGRGERAPATTAAAILGALRLTDLRS